MPRIAPTLYEFVELDNGEYLKVTEAGLRIFDRQDWLRVNRARARIKVLVDKIGIEDFREMVDEELEGDWVAERDFSIDHLLLEIDEEATAPEALPAPLGQPERRQLASSTRFVAANVKPQRQEGFSTVHDQGHPRRPDPGAVPRPRPDHARLHAAATPGRRSSRTSSCAGSATRRSTTSGSAAGARSRRRRRAHDHRRRLAAPAPTSCKLGITSLDGPQPRDPGAGRGDGDHRSADPQIHMKMSGCPNGCGQHHIGNIGFYGASIKVGGHTMPGLHRPHRRQLRGRRRRLRRPAQGAPARQARARRGRALAAHVRGRAQRAARTFNDFADARRHGRRSRTRSATSRCRPSSTSRT